MRHLPSFARPLLLLVAIAPFAACHAARAADPPKALTPTLDVEVEDHGPDKSTRLAKFSLSVLDGRAGFESRDGDLAYDLGVHAQKKGEEEQLTLVVKRKSKDGSGDVDVAASLPARPGSRVLVGQVERSDGRTTSVIARVR
jgi:hypothetical protein